VIWFAKNRYLSLGSAMKSSRSHESNSISPKRWPNSAVNKVLAASSRTKARDFVDLVSIDENYCPSGAVIIAASGKPPHYSPMRIIDEMRRRGLSVSDLELSAVKQVSGALSAETLRDKLTAALDRAED
jgi:hypothetical protein